MEARASEMLIPQGAPLVRDGAILLYRLYDIAEEIDLRDADARLLALALPSRLRFSRVQPKHIQIKDPPVSVSLGTVPLDVLGATTPVEVSARVYDYGAVSITFSLPVSGWTWSRFEQAGRSLADAREVDEAAARVLETLSSTLGPAIKRPHRTDWREDYTIYFVSALEPVLRTRELQARVDLASLLLSEPEGPRLGAAEREDTLRRSFSYYEDDLAVIDWNAAFVYEPSGERDVPDILEYATSQLLELRFYDDLLDRELDQIYDQVALKTRAWNPLFPSKLSALQRDLATLVLELTELTEKVENSIKVIDDLYLAKIYQGAVERFRIPRWQSSVQRKLAIVQSVHQLVQSRVSTGRSLLLETTIVLLIVIELLLAIVNIK
jgi:hypothetical protein